MDNLAYFILFAGCMLILVGVVTLAFEAYSTGETREWFERWMR